MTLEFEVRRDLPPPIGRLNDVERGWITEALLQLSAGDPGPLEAALEEILEHRVSEEEFGDYLCFAPSDRREILQRVAEQVPELTGIRLNHAGE